ncbi:hypothetical protein ST45_04495 [Prevotella pectinovora]|nr:hypothetical protein ST45_04495 [Prevotella pectinovora]
MKVLLTDWGIKKQQERKQIPALAASVLFGVIPRFGINTVIVLQFPSAADEAFALMGADTAMMMTIIHVVKDFSFCFRL